MPKISVSFSVHTNTSVSKFVTSRFYEIVNIRTNVILYLFYATRHRKGYTTFNKFSLFKNVVTSYTRIEKCLVHSKYFRKDAVRLHATPLRYWLTNLFIHIAEARRIYVGCPFSIKTEIKLADNLRSFLLVGFIQDDLETLLQYWLANNWDIRQTLSIQIE